MGKYEGKGVKRIPVGAVTVTGENVTYDETTGMLSLGGSASTSAITVTVKMKEKDSISTTFEIPATV